MEGLKMKLTKKSIIAFMCALLILISVFAGCTSKNNEESDSTVVSTSDVTKEETKLPPVEIQWLGYNTYAQPDENSPYVKMAEEKFNVDFKFWFIDDTKWNDQLNVKFAAGEMPDIIKIRGGLPTVKRWVDNGILAPIEKKMVKELAPSYYEIIENHPQSSNAWPSVSYNGKYYGLPRFSVNGEYPTVIVWNQTWLDNVGITKTPETIAEYEDAFIKFRNNDPDKNNKKDTYGLSDFTLPAILGAYGFPAIVDFKSLLQSPDNLTYDVKDGKVVLACIQPEMKEALALLNRWYNDNLIDPEFITSENTGGYWANSQAFFNQRIGITSMSMFYHWRYDLIPGVEDDKGGLLYNEFKKAQPNNMVVMGQAPIGPNGASGTPCWGAVQSTFLGLTTKGAKDPRIIESFLAMVEAQTVDEKWDNTLTYGIEGTDYTVTDGVFGGPTVVMEPKERIAKGLQLFNYFANPEWDKNRNKFSFAWADKYNVKKGYVDPVVPIVDAYSKNVNDLAKLTVETYIKIITGEASIDSFDDYVTKIRANGGDQIEKEVNEAYALSQGK